ncbi:CD3324 family protein [Brevibacillus sp. B_LB10_24]|uniref:CD3324 family protein n=1 Tax=Brevibacillus sp. B_LB10_24 TaxID=3380645 RepID=UPI0038BAE9BC
MKYVKATSILPEKLVIEIQKYVQGETIYIPKPKAAYGKWGSRSGGRKFIDERNNAIKHAFQNGKTIQQLAEDHFLATETIRKIVYSSK